MLVGDDGLRKLSEARVAVVGTGGVGAYAAEMLVRAGVGHIAIIDSDEVGESNINRQLIALHSTVGRPKVDVLTERLADINPAVTISPVKEFVSGGNIGDVLGGERIDFLVDAIDTLSPKLALILHCLGHGIPFVSSRGCGAKMDVTAVKIADISKTCECPLARMIRKKLGKMGIRKGVTCVFSTETPHEGCMQIEESRNKKSQVGTISYLPAVFGCACAQAALEHILNAGQR